jgi:glucose/arabinose dehydrogenase
MEERGRLALLALGAAAFMLLVAVFALDPSSSAGIVFQGDADCNQEVDSADALHVLRFVAEIGPFAACIDVAGDVDCSGETASTDALHILRFVAGLPFLIFADDCVQIGQPIDGVPAPTVTVTVTASPSPEPPPGGTPTPTGETPGPTPASTPTLTPAPPTAPGPTPTPVVTPPSTCSPAAGPEPAPAPPPGAGGYSLEQMLPQVTFSDMVELVPIPGTENEAAVARLNGQIWRVSLDGSFAPVLYGDLDPIVKTGGEEGLLSLAFSPNFQADRHLYVYYTRGSPEPSVVSRLLAGDGEIIEESRVDIIEIPQPYANHNGGRLLFGHDCYLYLSLGDGGSAGDPQNNGQSLGTLLGKVIRIGVLGQATYSIPADNPFVDGPGGNRDEIWAYGLRNPWRMSADRLTGDIWLGDVGQAAWEEVDRITGGGNYGWRCYEGFQPFNLDGCPDESAFQFPRAVYPNDGVNRAVAGGFVYRGERLTELWGYYLYADSYSGRIWAVNTQDNSDPVLLMQADAFIFGFAELEDGEVLVLTSGAVYRLSRN